MTYIRKILKSITLIMILTTATKNSELKEKAESIKIEVTQGRSTPISFTIISNFQELSQTIVKNLETSKRFVQSAEKSNADFVIKIKEEANGKISVEIIDVKQHLSLQKILINKINKKSQLKICNSIYEACTHEKGIFLDTLIFTVYVGKNQYAIYALNSDQSNLRKICDESIKNLFDLFLCDNKIFLSKYIKKDQAFSLLFFEPSSKTFYNVFTIKSSSVYAPVVYDREIYVAVTDNDTTGIYKKAFIGSTTYKSFKDFISDPTVSVITRVPGRIATAPTVSQGKIAFCADYNGRPSIYLYPNKRVSSEDGSYFDPNIKENSLAAIKIYQGKFHLVLINLNNGIERTLLSKYFIGRPTWSPCGNWIAVSCRDHGQKDIIYLIHKTGKYVRTIQTNYKIKNIIWMTGTLDEKQ